MTNPAQLTVGQTITVPAREGNFDVAARKEFTAEILAIEVEDWLVCDMYTLVFANDFYVVAGTDLVQVEL